jgi:hypothetical protein
MSSFHFPPFPYDYMLVCPERSQRQDLPQYHCTFHLLFERKDEAWFYNTFAKPASHVQHIQQFHPPTGDLFERLPNEVIDVIFDYILGDSDMHIGFNTHGHDPLQTQAQDDMLEDFITLGLSSARLWPLVLKRIHRGYQHNWAGEKVGFHHRDVVLTAEQWRNYGVKDMAIDSEYPRILHSNSPLGKWRWDQISYQLGLKWRYMHLPFHRRPGQHYTKKMEYDKGMMLEDREKIERDLSHVDHRSTDREWVLRNLTTRQYIRSDQLQEPTSAQPNWGAPPKPRGPLFVRMRQQCKALIQQIKNGAKEEYFSPWAFDPSKLPLTLATIFLVLICDTSHRETYWEPKDSPTRYLHFEDGPWCGCAFDLIPLDDHLRSQDRQSPSEAKSYEAWVDVSKEVVADIANLRFCIQRNIEMCSPDHRHYIPLDDQPALEDYWARVAKTRKLHRQWVSNSPPRPWVDESMYAAT